MTKRNRSSIVCMHEDHILGFHAEDPTSKEKYFFLPGGKIEKHETPCQAAIRETLEETGYGIQLLEKDIITKEYSFFWDGEIYLTNTVFYPAMLLNSRQEPSAVADASYHRGVDWIPAAEVEKFFGYHQDILDAVKDCISHLKNRT